MKIAVDMAWNGPTGIGRYAAEVLARTPEDFHILPIRSDRSPAHPLAPLHLAKRLRHLDCDTFWSPGFMPPAAHRTPLVITLHDLMHRTEYDLRRRCYYDLVLRALARRAAAIITVSRSTKAEIEHWMPGPVAPPVVVSYIGVDLAAFCPTGPLHPAVSGPYILCIGNGRPHKNLPTAVEAFTRARLPPDVKLVLAGTGALSPGTLAAISHSGLAARAKLLGPVHERDLPGLYRGALALLFPSLSEGFGLPVIEALACGSGVIASPCPAVTEAAPDAVVLIEPRSPGSIAAGLRALTESASMRARLREAGLNRARQPFLRWESVARVIWDRVRQCARPPSKAQPAD